MTAHAWNLHIQEAEGRALPKDSLATQYQATRCHTLSLRFESHNTTNTPVM